MDFTLQIVELSKVQHPSMKEIDEDALVMLNQLTNIFIEKIMNAANILVKSNGNKTLDSRDIQTAVRLALPGELARHSVKAATTYITKHDAITAAVEEEKKKSPVKTQKTLGLILKLSSVGEAIDNLTVLDRKKKTSTIFLTGVLEYLLGEILSLVTDNDSINQRDIYLYINNDEEFKKLLDDTILAGGVEENIFEFLRPKKNKK
jgi:histone H3/H4